MSENEGVKGCFRYSCIGCISLVAIGLGLIFLLSALQLSVDHEPKFEEQQTEQILPPPPDLPSFPAPPARPEVPPAPDAPGPLEAPSEPGVDAPIAVEAVSLGSVELPNFSGPIGVIEVDLDMGDFTIKPGPAGEPIRVDADYDTSRFELQEQMEQQADGSFVYKLKFGAAGGFWGLLLGGGNEGDNRVELTIPRGRPILLRGRIQMGQSRTDLGGLWLQDVDLEYKAGDHLLEFREPTPFPVGEMTVQGSMGALELHNLGQASPKKLEVRHGMGELRVDLQGEWRRDALAKISFKMGECRVYLPDNAKVDLERARVAMGEARSDKPPVKDLPPGAPTIKVDVSGSMGELRIER